METFVLKRGQDTDTVGTTLRSQDAEQPRESGRAAMAIPRCSLTLLEPKWLRSLCNHFCKEDRFKTDPKAIAYVGYNTPHYVDKSEGEHTPHYVDWSERAYTPLRGDSEGCTH